MIQVDENQYTGVGKIYAVGDVAGELASVADAQHPMVLLSHR